MKKFLIILFSIILVGGAGFAGWYFLLREDPLVVEFYGDEEIVELLSGDGEYKEGDGVTLTAKEKEGYEFVSWLRDGKEVSTSRVFTFTVSKSTSGKYTAQYRAKEFTITSQNSGIYNIANKASTDEEVDINIALPDGYRVAEMYYIESGTLERIDIKNNKFIMPPRDISIFISIVEIQYTIIYELNGGSFSTTPISTFTIVTPTFTLPTPVKEGYIFKGYSTTASGTPDDEFTISQGTKTNIKVYAHWLFAYYHTDLGTVTGSGTINIESDVSMVGTQQNLVVTPAEGWQLKELYYIIEKTQTKVDIDQTATSFTMPESDVLIYAVFEKIQYIVVAVDPVGGTLSANRTLAYIGDIIEVSYTAEQGYEFDNLYYYLNNDPTNHIQLTSKQFTMPNGHITIVVEFSLINYTITYVTYDGTILDANYAEEYSVSDFEVFLPTNVVKDHYNFEGWYRNPTFTGYKETSIQGSELCDLTFYAKYTICQYTIRFVNHDDTLLYQASFDFGSMPTYGGATPTKESTIDKVYEFSGWSPALAVATTDATYTAQYTESDRIYQITMAPTVHGSATYSGTGYYGEKIMVRPTPSAGYKNGGMHYIVEGTTEKVYFENYFYMPDKNITIYVTFISENLEEM